MNDQDPKQLNDQDPKQLSVPAPTITRRRFMETTAGLGLGAGAAALFSAGPAGAATPKKGGRFRVGIAEGHTSDSLDPATFEGDFTTMLARTHCNYLTAITPDNVIGPELAASWESTPDAATWTFELQRDVEFHNGKTFDADDAVASLNYHRGEGSKSAAKALLESMQEIKALDKQTVRVHLSSGSADFPYILSDYHLVMLPADAEDKVSWDMDAGTGGYVLQAFEPGISASFKRFPNYWKEGRAHFDEVELLAIADAAARTNALKTNGLDAITEVELKTAHLLDQDPEVNLIEVPSGSHVALEMQIDKAPFDNNDVRLALKFAMDRERILQHILRGHGTLGNDHPIGPVLPYYAADLEQQPFDPDRAKFHLKKAGMDSLSVSLSTSEAPMPGAVDLAVFYKEVAKQSNIDIDMVREPDDGYWSNVWGNKPFVLCIWGQRPTPDVIFTLGYSSGAPWNVTHFKHERFNQLLLEARAELDDAKRGELYFEMQRILRDEGGVIVPFFRNYVYAHRRNVMHDEKLAGEGTLDGYRAAERWWFA